MNSPPTTSSPVTLAPVHRRVGEMVARKHDVLRVVRTRLLDDGEPALAEFIAGRPALVVVSQTVDRLFGSALRAAAAASGIGADRVRSVSLGEPNKDYDAALRVVDAAKELRLPRDGVIVAVGGGVVLDVVGFAASQFRRGVAHVKIGTTLLAQVDAAVGLKCGVNHGDAKNMIGAFHPPELALVDGTFLTTLPTREVRCGLAEMVKVALVCDGTLFEDLGAHGEALLDPARVDTPLAHGLVDRAVATMLGQLEPNAYESELVRPVDFGHTISPALEARTRYDLKHGEAVAVDMAYFSTVAYLLGELNGQDHQRILELFASLGLPTWHPLLDDTEFLAAAIDSAAAHRGQRLNQPLPATPGQCTFVLERAELGKGLLAEATRLLERDGARG